MYRLTPRMLQKLAENLVLFHRLFDGGRCAGWQLEELFVLSIKSDTTAQHHVVNWREGGHDDKEDIVVRTNGDHHRIQIKAGQIKSGMLIVSGHRLGRFGGDLVEITKYLNNPRASIIATPYGKLDDDRGRKHKYKVCYVDSEILTGIDSKAWKKQGKQYKLTNPHGVKFSLRPSMSWQIWWSIPLSKIETVKVKMHCGFKCETQSSENGDNTGFYSQQGTDDEPLDNCDSGKAQCLARQPSAGGHWPATATEPPVATSAGWAAGYLVMPRG